MASHLVWEPLLWFDRFILKDSRLKQIPCKIYHYSLVLDKNRILIIEKLLEFNFLARDTRYALKRSKPTRISPTSKLVDCKFVGLHI